MDTNQLLDHYGFFQEGFNVLDIGCGVGYIPHYLVGQKKNVTYTGIDVDMGCIQQCRKDFAKTNFNFKRMNIKSDMYNAFGKKRAEEMTLEAADSSVDSVICHSLFTHLDTEEIAARYMGEIRRVLKSGGLLWTTWFTSPPNKVCGGTMRTVYDLNFVNDQLKDFSMLHSYGGETDGYHDQFYVASMK